MKSIIQAQGIHHITLNGADKKTSIDFWQNILGMKFIFEQPNLDDLNTNHLYLDGYYQVIDTRGWTNAIADFIKLAPIDQSFSLTNKSSPSFL